MVNPGVQRITGKVASLVSPCDRLAAPERPGLLQRTGVFHRRFSSVSRTAGIVFGVAIMKSEELPTPYCRRDRGHRLEEIANNRSGNNHTDAIMAGSRYQVTGLDV